MFYDTKPIVRKWDEMWDYKVDFADGSRREAVDHQATRRDLDRRYM